jgi:HEAT repeat protein
VTPADALSAREFDPFCGHSVLGTVNALADFSHSNALAQLVTAGTYRSELLITLGKVGPPRYANFIGRYRDDPDPAVRRAVAEALGLIDNEPIAVPVLIRLLSRGEGPDDFPVKWSAAHSLVAIGKRRASDGVRRRLIALFPERNGTTVALAARALAALGDGRGPEKLRALVSHPEPQVREEAVLALGELADRGSREAVSGRLADDSLAVRAAAVYTLGRIGGPAAVPALRAAVQAALEYEKELEVRVKRGESEAVLRTRHGLGVYDLRETLDQALTAIETPRGR